MTLFHLKKREREKKKKRGEKPTSYLVLATLWSCFDRPRASRVGANCSLCQRLSLTRSVRNKPRAPRDECKVRVLSAEGAKVRRRWKTSEASLSPEAQEVCFHLFIMRALTHKWKAKPWQKARQIVASLLSLCMAKWLRKWRRCWLYVRSNTKNAKSLVFTVWLDLGAPESVLFIPNNFCKVGSIPNDFCDQNNYLKMYISVFIISDFTN